MPVSQKSLAKRAFVSVLLELARSYNVAIDVRRDTADVILSRAFRKVALRVHPDKGGSEADQKRLNDARDRWEEANVTGAPRGRPPKRPAADDSDASAMAAQPQPPTKKGVYRLRSKAVLLTYQSFTQPLLIWGSQL